MDDAIDAKQVGKHHTDSVEMWLNRPKMVDAPAKARAMMCRMSV
jgi:hypothetical protein